MFGKITLFAALILLWASPADAHWRHHHHHHHHHHVRTVHHHVTMGDFAHALAAAKPTVSSSPETLISVFGRMIESPGSGVGLFYNAHEGLDLGFDSSSRRVNEIVSYIHAACIRRGLDPRKALDVVRHEGLGRQRIYNVGDGGTSFGIWQLHFAYRGHRPALGNIFMAETGLDPRNRNTWRQQTDFVLDYVKDHPNAWRTDWFGWQQVAWHSHHHHRHRRYA